MSSIEFLYRLHSVWNERLKEWRSPEDIELCDRMLTAISREIAFGRHKC
jgi:hypothetical protein